MHPLNLSLATNGAGQAVETVTDDAIDSLDPRRGENFDKLLRDGVMALIFRKAGLTSQKYAEIGGARIRPRCICLRLGICLRCQGLGLESGYDF